MNAELTGNLHHLHERVLASIGHWNEAEAGEQLHPDLSPALWHVGHVAVIEAFWLREVTLGEAVLPEWKALFFPENTPKADRATALPDKQSLLDFAARLFADNVARLGSLLDEPPRHALLKDAYIAHFLIQHCAQHLETLRQIGQQRALRHDVTQVTLRTPLTPDDPVLPDITRPGGEVTVGNAGEPWAYDNELPRHRATLAPFSIGARPASNAEYLGFMQSGGYGRPQLWSQAGWRWRLTLAAASPVHWRVDGNGQWYGMTPDGPQDLAPDAPVEGISRHEAEAFAHYCGCRLPTEAEWEHALNSGAMPAQSIGTWEWCRNNFYPYPGFKAFPYERYSVPWFDGTHFSLRGWSRHTHASVRRATFRNFYTADKRHIFAGVRLARDHA